MTPHKIYGLSALLALIGIAGFILAPRERSLPDLSIGEETIAEKDNTLHSITSKVTALFNIESLPPEEAPVAIQPKSDPTQVLKSWVLTGIVTSEQNRLATFKKGTQTKTLYEGDQLEGFTIKAITDNAVTSLREDAEYVFTLNAS